MIIPHRMLKFSMYLLIKNIFKNNLGDLVAAQVREKIRMKKQLNNYEGVVAQIKGKEEIEMVSTQQSASVDTSNNEADETFLNQQNIKTINKVNKNYIIKMTF